MRRPRKRASVELGEQAAADLAELSSLLRPDMWPLERIVAQAIRNQLAVIKATDRITANLKPFDPLQFTRGEGWPAESKRAPGKLLQLVSKGGARCESY